MSDDSPIPEGVTPSDPNPEGVTPSDCADDSPNREGVTRSDPIPEGVTLSNPSDPNIEDVTPSVPNIESVTLSDCADDSPNREGVTPSTPITEGLTPSNPEGGTPSNPNIEGVTPSDPNIEGVTPSDPITEGVTLFNSRRFWHAHEAWEKPWLVAKGGEREFLQGLIQLAAAYHHVQRGTLRGAVRLFDAALRRMATFPDLHLGIDRSEVVSRAVDHREKIARGDGIDGSDFPKFH